MEENNTTENAFQESIKIKIAGIGSSIGSKRISNDDLETRLKVSAESIESKTGIDYRFHCDPLNENLYILMASAAIKAAEAANISIKDIDGIFTASNPTGEFLLPNTATIVADLLGINAFYRGGNSQGCAGGLVALEMAFNKLIKNSNQGKSRNYLVLAGDQTSAMLQPGSLDEILFSDGASALLVTNDKRVSDYYFEIKDINNITYSRDADALKVRRKDQILEHNGRVVYKFAAGSMNTLLKLLESDTFPTETYLIPHQANLRIINQLTKDINSDLVYKEGIVKIGNTSPASVFIGLEDVYHKKLSPYKSIVLFAFGEGLTLAAAKLEANPRKNAPIKNDDLKIGSRCIEHYIMHKYMEKYKSKWT